MKRTTIILSILLVLTLLTVSVTPVLAKSATALDDDEPVTAESKISESLKEKMEEADEDEKIPVYIDLYSLNQSVVNQELLHEFGINAEQYDDKARYYHEIVPEIQINNRRICDIVDRSKIDSFNLCLNNEDSPIDIATRKVINKALLSDQDHYLRCYRQCIRKLIEQYKSSFIDDYNDIIMDIVESYSVECIIAQVEKKNLKELALDRRVKCIDYYVNVVFENSSWSSVSVTESDSITGLGSPYYNGGDGYDGSDIKIGIIEAKNGRFDPYDYNLSDLVNSRQLTFVQNESEPAAQISLHATSVTTLICGKKTVIGGKTYEGVAKGATVYQINCTDFESIECALEQLVYNCNVKVINMSLGQYVFLAGYGYYFYPCDSYIDNFIKNNKVSIVAASGNSEFGDSFVRSPAKAYRTIAVGAIDAKTSTNTLLNAPYSKALYSDYTLVSTTANKPDVVAPGSYIRIPYDANTTRKVAGSSGTSYAAPIVTGIVAQIMQVQPYAESSPLAVKTYLLCGASNNSLTGTTIVCGALTNESGAGLVNAINSIGYDYSYNNATELFGVFSTILEGFDYATYSTKYSIDLTAGEHVRIVLVFDTKPNNHNPGKDNMDLRLIINNNPSVNFSASAESEYNNVEIIDIVAPVSGTYSIQTRLAEHFFENIANTDLRYWIAWRTY